MQARKSTCRVICWGFPIDLSSFAMHFLFYSYSSLRINRSPPSSPFLSSKGEPSNFKCTRERNGNRAIPQTQTLPPSPPLEFQKNPLSSLWMHTWSCSICPSMNHSMKEIPQRRGGEGFPSPYDLLHRKNRQKFNTWTVSFLFSPSSSTRIVKGKKREKKGEEGGRRERKGATKGRRVATRGEDWLSVEGSSLIRDERSGGWMPRDRYTYSCVLRLWRPDVECVSVPWDSHGYPGAAVVVHVVVAVASCRHRRPVSMNRPTPAKPTPNLLHRGSCLPSQSLQLHPSWMKNEAKIKWNSTKSVEKSIIHIFVYQRNRG